MSDYLGSKYFLINQNLIYKKEMNYWRFKKFKTEKKIFLDSLKKIEYILCLRHIVYFLCNIKLLKNFKVQ